MIYFAAVRTADVLRRARALVARARTKVGRLIVGNSGTAKDAYVELGKAIRLLDELNATPAGERGEEP